LSGLKIGLIFLARIFPVEKSLVEVSSLEVKMSSVWVLGDEDKNIWALF